MEFAKPQTEHEWLQRLVGAWTASMPPPPEAPADAPPPEWTERVRSLQGLWVVGESDGEMPGMGPVSNVITLGYDPAKQTFVGTFVSSMMPNLWVYEGALEEDGTALALLTEGPDFEDATKTSRYREVIAFQDPDRRTFTSSVATEDGGWREIMRVEYRRKPG